MITVMTPTFNRGYILHNCYASLQRQTRRDFKWMIIDDGSNDNTEELVRAWMQEPYVDIQYIKKSNGGKASALNVGIDLLETEYAVCLDSDDIFYDNTIELALARLSTIDRDDCCGILALRHGADGHVLGGRAIPPEFRYVTAADVFLELNLRTEFICFYKSDILKRYRFPSFDGEKFVSPSWMQYEITKDHRFMTSWDKLCQCEYQKDGLTRNKRKVIAQNPRGYSCIKRFGFNLAPTLGLRIKHGIMYDCGCLIAGDKNWLVGIRHKVLAVVLLPLAWMVKVIRFDKYIKA